MHYINSRYADDGLFEYVVFQDVGNGGYSEVELPTETNHITIYEDDPSHPYLRQFNERLQGSYTWLYAIDTTDGRQFELHVPKGSILQGNN